MFHVNQQNQEEKYGQLARKLLKIATISGSKVVLRRGDQSSDVSTEFVHEFGTTDKAIGDVTAEVMLTTLGKVPSEMYYLEDTVFNGKAATDKSTLQTSQYAQAVASTQAMENNHGSSGHSSVLFILLIVLLVILLLCCISAGLIAKTRRKSSFFGKSDMECDSKCTGINQPLLDKNSDLTNKTSISCLRN
ncbi:uncharacterized protein LOC117605281 [Osmia lignaria lignaria]|uniref:uncharacterized protein LOC117605281 n=1 Tax=Osmia lignaria lignaria TaxID=1437193 RepID=UPI00402BEE66